MKKIFSAMYQWIFSSKRSSFLWGATLLALGIRLAIILWVSDPTHPEMYEHGAIAHNLYTGHGFAMHWPYDSQNPERAALMKLPPQHEGANQPPLNPYLIYYAYQLFGETSTAIIFLMLVYSVLSSLIPFVVYKTGVLLGEEKSARISALIASLFLPAAFAVTTFSGSPLYQLVGVVVLFFAMLTAKKPSTKSFLLLAMSCGVMALLRSEFFLLGFLIIATTTVLAMRRASAKRIARLGILSCVFCAGIIAPWTLRNYNLFHKFVPIVDRPWHEIWRGNNIYSTVTTYDEHGIPIWVNASRFPKIVAAMDSLPYNQYFGIRVDSVLRHEVIGYVQQHPTDVALLGAKKLFALFTVAYSPGITGNPLYIICMLCVTLTAIIGLIALVRQSLHTHDYSTSLPYLLFFGYYCAIAVTTFVLPRYQIYIYSTMLPLTGLGWDKITSILGLKLKTE